MICHVDNEIFHCMYKCKGVSVKTTCHVKHDLIALGWMANSYCRAHITCYKLKYTNHTFEGNLTLHVNFISILHYMSKEMHSWCNLAK